MSSKPINISKHGSDGTQVTQFTQIIILKGTVKPKIFVCPFRYLRKFWKIMGREYSNLVHLCY